MAGFHLTLEKTSQRQEALPLLPTITREKCENHRRVICSRHKNSICFNEHKLKPCHAGGGPLKFRTKLVCAFLLVSIVPLLAVCLGLYAHTRDSRLKVINNHLESVAAIQRSRIEAINAQNLERLNLVTRDRKSVV